MHNTFSAIDIARIHFNNSNSVGVHCRLYILWIQIICIRSGPRLKQIAQSDFMKCAHYTRFQRIVEWESWRCCRSKMNEKRILLIFGFVKFILCIIIRYACTHYTHTNKHTCALAKEYTRLHGGPSNGAKPQLFKASF